MIFTLVYFSLLCIWNWYNIHIQTDLPEFTIEIEDAATNIFTCFYYLSMIVSTKAVMTSE